MSDALGYTIGTALPTLDTISHVDVFDPTGVKGQFDYTPTSGDWAGVEVQAGWAGGRVDNFGLVSVEDAYFETPDGVRLISLYADDIAIPLDVLFGPDAAQLITDTLGVNMYGNRFGNTMNGGAQADRLFGGGGADILFGEGGNDYLQGNRGDDQFVFNELGGVDHIEDFRSRQGDIIDLQRIDADEYTPDDQHFQFIDDNPFHFQAGELRYNQRTGRLLGDTDGDAIADFKVRIDNHANLDYWDFFL
jgi:Ca2+-binding RTX toxin-like protein